MMPEKMSDTFFFLRFSLSTVIVFQISLVCLICICLYLLILIFLLSDNLFITHQVYTLNELHVLAWHVVLLFNQEVKKRLEPPPTSQKKKKKKT